MWVAQVVGVLGESSIRCHQREVRDLMVSLMEDLGVLLMEIIREVIVDPMSPTQGQSSICISFYE